MKILPRTSAIIKKALLTVAVVAASVVALQALPASASEVTLGGGQDCDANAVVHCGAHSTTELVNAYNAGKESTSAKSIQDIYSYFGITGADISSMQSTAVAGHVTSNGEVFVDGSNTSVATSAITAGRLSMPGGSTAVNNNGTVFYTRPTSVSFRSGSIPAFVVMQNGVFKYAILSSCGNPVKATPKTPDFAIEKTVSKFGQNNFSKDLNVTAGDKVTYRVVVASTGSVPLVNLVVRDALPANVTYVGGTLTSSAGGGVDAGQFFAAGVTIPTFANGTTITYQFDAIVGQNETPTTCTTETLDNVAHTATSTIPEKTSEAKVEKACKPVTAAPVCTVLNIVPGDNRSVRISDVQYTLNGATVKSGIIDWGDSVRSDAIDAGSLIGQTHTYAADGHYMVSLTLTFMQGDKTIVSSEPACQKPVSYNTITPAAAPVLPATGAGMGIALALFASVTVAATGAYRRFLSRRLA
ncbi:MAG: hypothetical protein JWM81_317 [Candidatus Saccharibacteria bacterium]|nr:hypothetical protein [Candidatus Saccharibacteria bacterium]